MTEVSPNPDKHCIGLFGLGLQEEINTLNAP